MTRWLTIGVVLGCASCSGAGGPPLVPMVVDPAGPPAAGLAQIAIEPCTPGEPPLGEDGSLPPSDIEVRAWPWGVEIIHSHFGARCKDEVDVEAEVVGREVIVREVWRHYKSQCSCAAPHVITTQVGLEPGEYTIELELLSGKELESALFTTVEIASEATPQTTSP
ncbi:MAG: hypothetical protein FJ109_17485 [Deltaproteobacteria bacterium]|nr:hypothetical protein [Deltaproteobacteria bacterium]